MPFGFGPDARLKNSDEFGRVFREGRKLVGKNLILWHLQTPSTKPARLGLSVSSKVGNAVRRNRLKRLAREAFRLSRPRLANGKDFVIYFRRGCRWKKLEDAQSDLLSMWGKAGALRP